MNFRQIEAFRAIVQTGTVTAAGEMLFISQPAVSRLLAELERKVGFTLFDRARGRLRLTPEGQALYREVERSFVGLERMKTVAREIAVHSTGVLRVLGMPILSGGVLPSVLAEMIVSHPDISVSLGTEAAGTVADHVASGSYDVGFAMDLVPNAAAVNTLTLASRKLRCIFKPTHPLAQRETIGLDELAEMPYVAFTSGSAIRSRLDLAFRQFDLQMVPVISATTVESVCRLVEEGCGIAIVHPFTEHITHRHNLVSVPVELDMTMDVLAITRLDVRPSRLVEALISKVTNAIDEMA